MPALRFLAAAFLVTRPKNTDTIGLTLGLLAADNPDVPATATCVLLDCQQDSARHDKELCLFTSSKQATFALLVLNHVVARTATAGGEPHVLAHQIGAEVHESFSALAERLERYRDNVTNGGSHGVTPQIGKNGVPTSQEVATSCDEIKAAGDALYIRCLCGVTMGHILAATNASGLEAIRMRLKSRGAGPGRYERRS